MTSRGPFQPKTFYDSMTLKFVKSGPSFGPAKLKVNANCWSLFQMNGHTSTPEKCSCYFN